MANLKNNQYQMKVHGNRDGIRETLVLTFSSKAVAMAAYYDPKLRDAGCVRALQRPERIPTAVYRDSAAAVDSVLDFFKV